MGEKSDTEQPLRYNFLFIHGAWAGAWVWDNLVSELEARGHHCTALDLPGDGFHAIPADRVVESDYYDCLQQALQTTTTTKTVLVGHSGGGMLVTAAMDRFPDQISHAIWIAGFLLPNGESFDDIQDTVTGRSGGRFGVTPFIQLHDNSTSIVPAEVAIEYFFHDATSAVAQTAAQRLTQQPSCGHRMRTKVEMNGSLPKLYVVATQDRSVLPAAQRLMCEGVTNLTLREMDTGHVPQLTRPKELSDLLEDWLLSDP